MILRTRSLVCVALLLLALPVFAEDANIYGLPKGDPKALGISVEKLDATKAQLNGFVEKKQLPGFVMAVVKDGKVGYFEAFGQRDVERGKPMTPDTIFRMYSMTKPITGAAVMTLVDAGKISVDDPVSKYIPEFKDMQVLVENPDHTTKLVPAERPITLKHLMTHTSGLSYGFLDKGKLGDLYREKDINSDGSSGITLEEFAKRVAAMPLKFQPGTAWNYGVSIDILGRVVEVASGKRFGDYMQEKIFGPLKMNDAGFSVPAAKADRLASNYGPNSGGMKLLEDAATSPFLKIPSQDSGGGGSVMTCGDYLRFAQMLLNGGELDGVRVLSKKAVDEMTSNQLPAALGDAPLSLLAGVKFKGVGFGYCGAVPMAGANTYFGDDGEYTWGGLASTTFWIDKKNNVVGIVLTQLVPDGTYPIRSIMHNGVKAAIAK